MNKEAYEAAFYQGFFEEFEKIGDAGAWGPGADGEGEASRQTGLLDRDSSEPSWSPSFRWTSGADCTQGCG